MLQVHNLAGEQEAPLSTVKLQKLRWFGHTVRQNHPTGYSGRCTQKRSPEKKWLDNLKEWTELPLDTLLQTASDRDKWRNLVTRTVVAPPPHPNDESHGSGDDDDIAKVDIVSISLCLLQL